MKPEIWHDEKISNLSRDARLLFIGLMTMADDEGRFRARRSAIVGWLYPDDDDAFGSVDAWISEIKETGLILFYIEDGRPYGAFRHWAKHQRINKPSQSDLPPPPDAKVVRENRVKKPGAFRANSGSATGELPEPSQPIHSPTRDPIRSDQISSIFEYWQERCGKQRAKLTPARLKHVTARLNEGYPVEDIKRGIDGAALNPPRSDDGVTHDDLVSVCRNGDQLERYIDRASAKPAANGGNGRQPPASIDDLVARDAARRAAAREAAA